MAMSTRFSLKQQKMKLKTRKKKTKNKTDRYRFFFFFLFAKMDNPCLPTFSSNHLVKEINLKPLK